ncbi:hypothetical protein SLU01_22140 [Sporosarcina luteola]|uniref:Uncharacterized protein n=1 Tax=Sporosarcina luteola TaxID=582850 RepID=A0A511Z8Y3_9BACL|nr:hypothetical protein [Sporosarcina luteola]GEN83902.1 hypothetical protein SLU01_22140 [Sporosarcina luteola]
MFGRKKSKAVGPDKTYFNVGIISVNELDDDQYEVWTDDLMDAADNVGSTTSLLQADWDNEQLKILIKRFPEVEMNETVFMINEIIQEDIKKEIKLLEQNHKWKKFFNTIPLTDYIDAEDRVVMDASKTLFCTNDVQEAMNFLEKQAAKTDI